MSAACSDPDIDPTWFDATFPDESPKEQQARHAKALGVCAGCPIRQQCRDDVQPGDDGVRGGEVLPHIWDRHRRSPYPDGTDAQQFFLHLRATGTVDKPARPQRPLNCGEPWGHARHHERKEPACQKCKDARNARDRERRAS